MIIIILGILIIFFFKFTIIATFAIFVLLCIFIFVPVFRVLLLILVIITNTTIIILMLFNRTSLRICYMAPVATSHAPAEDPPAGRELLGLGHPQEWGHRPKCKACSATFTTKRLELAYYVTSVRRFVDRGSSL